eukprot:TRINITY_DN52762_c0_g1_i1.p1 TRINITY_DN52762_c0_g1~~TRINITY_DN52762_c0_g1_i1.p1  ORF type:complete len:267 (+),score=47.60 TRINITY_DN52762_c0_g1_i1:56-802(+)
MPRQQPETLLAGNVAVSLGQDGSPVATLMHPSGSTCQILLPGARVTSWRDRGGEERLIAGPAGGLMPCGLESVVSPSAWSIESLVGCAEGDSATFMAFAETRDASGVPVHARVAVTLSADRLNVALEVSHAGGDEMQWEEEPEADEAPAQESRAKKAKVQALNLPGLGLQGAVPCSSDPGAQALASQDASAGITLDKTGLGLQTVGFCAVKTAVASDGPQMQFQALAPVAITLQPGETVSGSICLALQ